MFTFTYIYGTQELEKSIARQVQEYVGSELKISDQGCRPFFVVFRDGNMVGVVNGCNTPVLRMLIDLHVPKIQKKTNDE